MINRTNITSLTDAIAAYDEEVEGIGWGWESHYEVSAEHKGETARFGDSWPGAQLQLANSFASLKQAEIDLADFAAVWNIGPELGPWAWQAEYNTSYRPYDEAEEDCPF